MNMIHPTKSQSSQQEFLVPLLHFFLKKSFLFLKYFHFLVYVFAHFQRVPQTFSNTSGKTQDPISVKSETEVCALFPFLIQISLIHFNGMDLFSPE